MKTSKKEIQQQDTLTEAHNDFAKGMKAYSYFKVHNRATSDDLVQDTFIKTWKYLVRGGEIVLMRAFLYHVLNRLIIDEYRKHKPLSLDVLLEKGYEPSADHAERLIRYFDGKVALLLIDQLPVRYQKIMHMRYKQGLSLEEIAAITGQSKNAVAVQAHRGLAKLKELYGHLNDPNK